MAETLDATIEREKEPAAAKTAASVKPEVSAKDSAWANDKVKNIIANASQQPSPDRSQQVGYADADSPQQASPRIEANQRSPKSGYWGVMIPALTARYLPEALMKLGVARAVLAEKSAGQLKAISDKLDTAYGLATGVLMMGVTTFYMQRTYGDIKRVFAEPIAWETGKKPEDVTWRDIAKSDNTLVQAAKHNFIKYNTRRYAVNLPFFGKHAIKGLSGDAAVGLGVASNSIYLMNDVFNRKETFFERLQGLIELKVQHTDQLGEKINAADLINLYELHARDKDWKHTFYGRMDTEEWQHRLKIFGRMADLLNQTYGNEPKKEPANFTLAKMIYLMGHGMVGSANVESSCAYIEAANRHGIAVIKDIAAHGGDAKYAQERYLSGTNETPVQEQPQTGFAAKFAPDAALSKTDKITMQRAAASEAAYMPSA